MDIYKDTPAGAVRLAIAEGSLAVKGDAGRTVDVVSPMHDLSVANRDNGEEPVVVRHTRRQDSAVHFAFEDHDAPVVGMVHLKLVR
jgi:hypothetical protein